VSQADIADRSLAGKEGEASPVSERQFEDSQFFETEIDWAAAAPSWWGLVAGLLFPAVLAVALLVVIDLALAALLHTYFTGTPTWLLAILVPVGTIGAVTMFRLLQVFRPTLE
jgi:hypothetical protein